MVEDIEAELQHLGQGEVPTSIIGEMVMERLRKVDRVAYIRYASVYRDFQDIESFELAVKDLREGNTQLSLPESGTGRIRRRRRSTRPVVQRQPPPSDLDGHQPNSGTNGILKGDSIP